MIMGVDIVWHNRPKDSLQQGRPLNIMYLTMQCRYIYMYVYSYTHLFGENNYWINYWEMRGTRQTWKYKQHFYVEFSAAEGYLSQLEQQSVTVKYHTA